MNKLFNIDFKINTVSTVLLILRIGIATFMLVHGLPKLQMLFSGEIQFPGVMGMSPTFSLALTVLSEVVCSILILIGLGTRLASIPLIITMLVAVFLIHGNDPFSKQELGLHYLLIYIVLFILGSGKYSFDAIIQNYLIKK
ncbi:DoxX family protein [Psychroserpens mesophilus]|uniref:DoxX family protein n=1 Tax=Psychroserpens mesophilus TaxID=325473 RepID=UPI003D65AF0C